MTEREEACKLAKEISLVDLLKKVIFEDYTPGIEDEILIKRVTENFKMKKTNTRCEKIIALENRILIMEQEIQKLLDLTKPSAIRMVIHG